MNQLLCLKLIALSTPVFSPQTTVIFLGNKTQGFTEALDSLVETIPDIEHLPEALTRLVGFDEVSALESNQPSESENSLPLDDIDFLLTKPANDAQKRVISRLEKTGSVLVQGPPGTGKSHTIANIIGHLLANGKTVLVSSHTPKALKVVRDKVAKPLQPLCVSVLDNDVESKSQLEESVNGIVGYLSRTDYNSLSSEVNQLSERRILLKQKLKSLESKALEIRKNEYADIVVSGNGIPPSEAARKIKEKGTTDGWIPGPLKQGAPPPLNETELAELYSTNISISHEEELCISEELPNLENILSPNMLRELVARLNEIDREIASTHLDLWATKNQNAEELSKLCENIQMSLQIFSSHQWIQKVVEDSQLGDDHILPWHNLINLVNTTCKKIAERSEPILKHGPVVSGISPLNESIKTCNEIIGHLLSGKSLGVFQTAFNRNWKCFIASARVDDGTPSTIKHFEAILALLESSQLRRELSRRWERQVVAIGGPNLTKSEPEVSAKSLLSPIELAATWTTKSWEHLKSSLTNQGFKIQTATEKLALDRPTSGYILQIQNLVQNLILPALESRKIWIQLQAMEDLRDLTLQTLRHNSSKTKNALTYLNQMIQAIQNLNIEDYETSYNRYIEIKSKVDIYKRRLSLLNVLAETAPSWSEAISLRAGIHGKEIIPGNLHNAWNICQWRNELDRRGTEDYSSTQREIQRIKNELNDVNAQYVENLAWRFQHKRTGLPERQALTGWQQIQNRITRTGRGVRDVQLRKESRKLIKNCKNAVPVWIMPLSKVFDNFDLVKTKFDVLILDEASQSDITALAAFVIAKQVIVVGDKQQVTPYAVGQNLGQIQSLIDELLQGIPNRVLYDGRTSVYDLAEQAFGETIRLVEHFRCVPDIIDFSNHLSYEGEIKPLRESSSSPFTKHCIAHRVDGANCENKVNHKEATEIASIIAAMVETKEYANTSIGVISLLGQEQSVIIDNLLQRKIPTEKYSNHSILCGNASHFQGDERDVILISMVDSCHKPPLRMRQSDDFKKTFNVAASRARNQLWVVHSLNPNVDLQPGDLRLRLIQHAENPKALGANIEEVQKRADPRSVVFEQNVIKDLMEQGFRVTPQVEVGAYTIDMVIEGTTRRIAIECDGDRYHPIEKLNDDIQRQMVLERLGWTFIRIRGSEYFRNKESTLRRVIAELDEMNIERLGAGQITTTENQNDDLQRRILKRALEIRKEWETQIDHTSTEDVPIE